MNHDDAVAEVWNFVESHPDVLDGDGTINSHFAAAVVQADDLGAGYDLFTRDLEVLSGLATAGRSPLERAANTIGQQLRDQVRKS